MKILLIIFFITMVILAFFLLDRFALWAERKGWIYYRHSQGKGTAAVGNALLELHSMLDAEAGKARLEIKEEREMKRETDAPPFDDEEKNNFLNNLK